MSKAEINVGIMLALSPAAELDALRAFAGRVVADCEPELEDATGVPWRFHYEDPTHLSSDDPHRPPDFLDEASLRMVEGPYDVVVVITDVGLVSRRQRLVAGLASSISHMAVLSTRRLLVSPRGEPLRQVSSEAVRWNAAALFLHLMGHIFGLDHSGRGDEVMVPFRFQERTGTPRFAPSARRKLTKRAMGFPEHEYHGEGLFGSLWFHLSSAVRHPVKVLKPLLRNRAPLLPLALPTLAAAAVTPTFILVFTAEIWDVGLNMPSYVAWTFPIGSVLVATWYLLQVQNLFFPHKEKNVITEHLAVVNTTILLTMLLAMLGLLLMVSLLMLFVETYVFPPNLISEWPTLEDPVVTLEDKFLLASFISGVGVLTGALAGGLESRDLIRHLALFEEEP